MLNTHFMPRPVILASSSARRQKILAELGLPFVPASPEVAEVWHRDDPDRTVRENAMLKCRWGASRFPEHAVIAADTVIDLDGHCVPKPEDVNEAHAFLVAFSGRTHTVLTGVGLAAPSQEPAVVVCRSEVTFRRLDDATIWEYLSRVDPLDKAGAYDIDQNGELLIDAYTGERTNIMGLPAGVVAAWAAELGAETGSA